MLRIGDQDIRITVLDVTAALSLRFIDERVIRIGCPVVTASLGSVCILQPRYIQDVVVNEAATLVKELGTDRDWQGRGDDKQEIGDALRRSGHGGSPCGQSTMVIWHSAIY